MNQNTDRAIRFTRAKLLRWIASAKILLLKPATTVNHAEVLAHLAEEGGLTVRYGVLTALSCAIAILGLLLSSPAVIIGAMLISPLMSPIILFGFSLATLNLHLVRRSLTAIAVGTLLAVGQSAIIVWLSPLQAITPEILARTQPNLFDLLVAIFSAIAGAYAVSQRVGETIVGVAIATALMPPLAVIGYGIATHNWAIFSGSGGLFMTNLLAIGLTVSLVAKFFGFGARNASHVTLWHTLSIVAVFAVLSVPLGLSLKQIAGDAVQTSKVRSTLQNYFAPLSGHIYGVKVLFPEGRPVEVEALVLVKKPRPAAEAELQKRLKKSLGTDVALSLSQVPVQAHLSLDKQAIEELVRNSNQQLSNDFASRMAPDMAAIAAAQAGVALANVSKDPAAKRVILRADEHEPAGLAALRAADEILRRRYPGWTFEFLPQPAAFPSVMFAEGKMGLDPEDQKLLGDIVWALGASGTSSVRVMGYANIAGTRSVNRRIAQRRARAVAAVLQADGIAAETADGFPVPGQARLERQQGQAKFRRVDIIPLDGK